MEITFKPIGYIKSPFLTQKDVPRWYGEDQSTLAELIVNKEYLEAMADMKPGERYMVIFHFHKPENELELTVTTRKGNKRALFSTHASVRPNMIGVTVINIVSIEGCRITFTGCDMLDGTPVLDIKNYNSEM